MRAHVTTAEGAIAGYANISILPRGRTDHKLIVLNYMKLKTAIGHAAFMGLPVTKHEEESEIRALKTIETAASESRLKQTLHWIVQLQLLGMAKSEAERTDAEQALLGYAESCDSVTRDIILLSLGRYYAEYRKPELLAALTRRLATGQSRAWLEAQLKRVEVPTAIK